MVLFACAFLVLAVSAQNEYIDKYGRDSLYSAAAAYSMDPKSCLTQGFPGRNYHVVNNEEMSCCTDSLCRVYVAVSNSDSAIIVGFRGPAKNNVVQLDILKDLKPTYDFYSYGMVEDYFVDALDSVWRTVNMTLSQSSTRSYRVTFVGHSTGGAMAALAAMRASHFMLRPSEQIFVYTYGEPRVGNKDFATYYDRRLPNTWRVVHNADIVPHLSLCSAGNENQCNSSDASWPYHHATEVWYANDMRPGSTFTICTKSDEDTICSDKLKKFDESDHVKYFQREVQNFGIDGCIVRAAATTSLSLISALALFCVYSFV